MSVMVVVTSLQVIYRYVLSAPLSWSEEASRYCFVWIVFLGAVLGLERGVHIGVDLLTNRLPPVIRQPLAVVSHVLIGSFCILVAYASWPVLEVNMLQRSPALDLPMTYVYVAIPVSMLLMVSLLILRAVDHVYARRDTSLTGDVM
jgi:TRAP-type C4-dicarboxylate transport system permease small subunit